MVTDLSAKRVGDRVVLRWTTPSRTTDDLEIKGAMTAELCRETDARPALPAARLAACTPVVRTAAVPGPSETADTLPVSLRAGPAVLLAYRIQIFNSTGHSSGNSTAPAYAAAGSTPAAVASLQATASEQGAVLEWKSERDSAAALETGPAAPPQVIDFSRIDLSLPPAPEKRVRPAAQPSGKTSSKSRPVQPKKTQDEASNEVHLRAPDTAPAANPERAGTVDTTAAMGDTYTYTAQRVRALTLGNHQLEIASEPSAPVTMAMRDTFPPKPPTGLATIAGTTAPDAAVRGAKPQPYIDLSWEPNTEPDLAGYRVYRQLARPDGTPQGPLARLTPLPIAVPAYRDVAVRPGQGYIYTVTAVDAAGNESAPSAKAHESVPEAAPE